MLREFEIFNQPSAPSVAVKRGFCWPGFFFTWIWAFARGLWLQGGLILLCSIGILLWRILGDNPIGPAICSFILGLAGISPKTARAAPRTGLVGGLQIVVIDHGI